MTMFRSVALAALLGCGAAMPAAMAQEAGLIYVQPLSADGVRQVQGKLNAMAGYAGPLDGTWGPASEAALRSFQQSRGLQVTGQMNQATAATMGLDPTSLVASATAAPAAPAAPTTFALSGDSTRILQARLRQLGFYNGAIDGAWGAGSQAALQNFQAARGLPADGRITAATVQALGIDPSTMQPQG